MHRILRGCLCIAALGASVASGDPAGFDGQRYAPAAGAAGGFTVERPYVPPHLVWGLALFLDYADDPVVVRDAAGAVVSTPLAHALTVDLIGSVALFDVFELAADLPLHAVYQGDPLLLNGQLLQAGPGVGDLRLVPKLVLPHSGRSPFSLGFAAPITFPTGSTEALRGDGVVTLNPELLLGVRSGRFSVNVNGGILVRPGGAVLGQEVTLGAGALFALLPHRDLLDLTVESTGGVLLSPNAPDIAPVPWELLGGLVVRPAPGWEIYLGAGPGIVEGVGAARYRIVGGVRYTPRPVSSYADRDDDGVPDFADRCPNQPEDYNGYQDGDGCPDRDARRYVDSEHYSDRDHDGVPDDEDECPDEPEPYHPGFRDGCPEGEAYYRNNEIVLRGKVQFETGSTALKPKSERLLDRVALVLKEHPEVRHVRVEGHTDEVGPAWTNQQLSERRAETVKHALVRRGIAPGRLSWRGYGETRPIASNSTKSGRAKNRRVEFKVVG